MFFLFREKERTKEKSIAFGLFIRRFVWIRTFYGILYWEGAFAFFRLLSRPEPAAIAMLAALPLTARCYLFRFGIPRAGFRFLRLFAPAPCSPLRRLRGLFGALPALNHISKLSAGNARLTQSGCIRIASLAAPAINQSGRGSSAAYIALLYEHLTRPESGAHLRATLCGLAATFLITHYAL